MIQKRSEMEIQVAIINAIWEEERRNGTPRKSMLQYHTCLNWKTLNRHLNKLQAKELVAREGMKLTERGLDFLKTFRHDMEPQLRKYGLLTSTF